MFTGRETALTGSFMKPTDRSFLKEEEDDEEEDREDLVLAWITVGIVYWRDMEGILVEFLRMERGWEAVVTVVAKEREGGVAVTLAGKGLRCCMLW